MRQLGIIAALLSVLVFGPIFPLGGFTTAFNADAATGSGEPNEPRALEDTRAEYKKTYNPYSAPALRIAWLSALKLRADQAFISAGIEEPDPARLADAASRYEMVEENACDLTSVGGNEAEANTIALLCQEAKYRSLLLKHGIGFWGLTRLRDPASPVVHLKRLRTLMADMRRVHDAILAGSDEAEDLDRLGNSTDIGAADVRIENERGDAQLKRLEIESRESRWDQRNYMLSIEGMRAEQRIAQQDFDAANAQYQAAQASLNQSVLQGISQFSGVDVATLDQAVHGDLGPALLHVADIPEVKSAVGEWVKGNESLSAAFSEAQGFEATLNETVKKYNDVKSYIEKGREVIDAVRNPNIENLERIGNAVVAEYCKQNAADCETRTLKLRQQVAAEKPFFLMLQKASEEGQKGDFVRSQLNSFLMEQIGNVDASLQTFVRDAVQNHVTDIKRYYRTVLTTIWEKTDNADFLSRGLADVLALNPRSLVIDPRLKDFLKSVCKDELAKTAKAVGGTLTLGEQEDLETICLGRELDPLLPAHSIEIRTQIDDTDPARRVVTATLSFKKGATVVKKVALSVNRQGFDELLNNIDTIADARRDELIARSQELLTSWTKVGAAARQRVVSILPLQAIDGFIEKAARAGQDGFNKAAGGASARALFDRVIGDANAVAGLKPDDLAGDANTEKRMRFGILQDLANVEAGISAARKMTGIQLQEAQAAIPAGTTASQPVNPSSKELAYATMALNAAFPGAGIAVSAVQNLFASFDALDKMTEAGKRIQGAMEAESRFMDLVHKTEAAQEIIGVEAQLAQKTLEVRDLQLALYQANADLITQASAERRQRAQRRLPLYFYLTERMREEYDLLDLAIQRWAGFEVSPSGALVDLIKSDPQNIRYATDSSIHLFTWFDRSDEGTRTDVDLTLVHWEQLMRLAEDSCKVVGCDIGLIEMSEVRQSRPIDIRQMVTSKDQKRFEDWRDCKNKTKGGALCLHQPAIFSAVIRPTLAQVYANRNDYNLRVVAIRAGYGKEEDLGEFGEQLNIAHGLTLRHPGVSVIYDRQGRQQFEYLLPRSAGGFDRAAPFDLSALNERWAEHDLPVKTAFEGYGLLSDWLITLEGSSFNSPLNQTAYLRFAYQAMRSDNDITEIQAIESLSRRAPALDLFEYFVTWTIRHNGLPERRVEKIVTLEELSFLGEAISKQANASGTMPSLPPDLRCEREGKLWMKDSVGSNSCMPLSWSNLAERFGGNDQLKTLALRLSKVDDSEPTPSAITVGRRCKTEAAYVRDYYEGLLSEFRNDRLAFQKLRPTDSAAITALPLGLGGDKAARVVNGAAQTDLWSVAQQQAPKEFRTREGGRCDVFRRAQPDILLSFEGARPQ